MRVHSTVSRRLDHLDASFRRHARRCLGQCLATWAVVKLIPWGGIIALAQVAEAVQTAVPFAARLRGTNGLSATLDALFIDGQLEWEDVYFGRFNEEEIIRRRHKLMTLGHGAELKNLPDGLPLRPALFRLAQADANAYFKLSLLMEDTRSG